VVDQRLYVFQSFVSAPSLYKKGVNQRNSKCYVFVVVLTVVPRPKIWVSLHYPLREHTCETMFWCRSSTSSLKWCNSRLMTSNKRGTRDKSRIADLYLLHLPLHRFRCWPPALNRWNLSLFLLGMRLFVQRVVVDCINMYRSGQTVKQRVEVIYRALSCSNRADDPSHYTETICSSTYESALPELPTYKLCRVMIDKTQQ